MKGRFNSPLIGFFMLALCLPAAYGLEMRVGVVYDDTLSAFSEQMSALKTELKGLLPQNEHISFAEAQKQNSVEEINATISRFEADEGINAIIALGALSSHVLSARPSFKKPSVAVNIIDSALQGLRLRGGKSAVDNFGFISLNVDYERQIDVFSEVVAFSKLHLVANGALLDCIPSLEAKLKKIAAEKDAELLVIRAKSPKQVIKELKNAQAVYLLPLSNFSDDELKSLTSEINKMKIPTMSMRESAPKAYGVFISLNAEIGRQKLARRLAIDLRRILHGENPKNFQTDFIKNERLTVNAASARQISIFPTWAQMADAIIVDENDAKKEKVISIKDAIETALLQNLKILAKRQELNTAKTEVEKSRSEFQPQFSLYTRHTALDKDRAQIIFTPAEHTTVLGSELKILLNSEKAKMGIDVKKLIQAAKKQEERALILDITKEAAVSYLNVLKAKALQTIKRDNLEVSRANLEIAKLREQIGLASPAEVFRWQIQMANSREALISASAARKKAEIALNQLLNAPQEQEFATLEQDIYSSDFLCNYKAFAPYIDNINSFKHFRNFMVADTFNFSPEIQQMNKMLELAKRRLRSAKRGNKRPTVALIGGASQRYHKRGRGSKDVDTSALSAVPPLAPLSSAFKAPDNTDWSLTLDVSVPLYDGADKGRLKTEQKQLESEIERLQIELNGLKSRLEMRTRASLEDARVSFSNIVLSKERAEYAQKVLKIVQNAYSQGVSSILDLIDAQNAFLTAKEASANAVFVFTADLALVGRAVGSFDFMFNRDTTLAWRQRLHEYFKSCGIKIIKRKESENRQIFLADPKLKEAEISE